MEIIIIRIESEGAKETQNIFCVLCAYGICMEYSIDGFGLICIVVVIIIRERYRGNGT